MGNYVYTRSGIIVARLGIIKRGQELLSGTKNSRHSSAIYYSTSSYFASLSFKAATSRSSCAILSEAEAEAEGDNNDNGAGGPEEAAAAI